MVRSVSIGLASLLVGLTARAGGPDPCEAASALFARGAYAEGQTALLEALGTPGAGPEQKARILACLASFYEDLVGNVALARRHWHQIRSVGLPADHALRKQAEERLTAIRLAQERFAEQAAILSAASRDTDVPEVRDERVKTLGELVRVHADFPDVARAHFAIGQHLYELGRYGAAVRAFDRAVALKPAIGRMLPVESLRSAAFRAYIKQTVPLAARTVIVIVLAFGVVLLARSRPLQWLRAPHLFAGLGALLVWCLVFGGLALAISRMRFPGPEQFSRPVILKSAFYEAGGERLTAIFWYGLLVVAGTFIVALGTAGWRPAPVRGLTNTLVALLLGVSTMACHYTTYFVDGSERIPDGDDVMSMLRGTLYSFVGENEHDLPDTVEEIEQMLKNATDEERQRILEHHLDYWRSGFHDERTARQLAEELRKAP